ncbi:MAG: hypothetical protein P8X90_35255, partial [Desulfobacterales bacterium]
NVEGNIEIPPNRRIIYYPLAVGLPVRLPLLKILRSYEPKRVIFGRAFQFLWASELPSSSSRGRGVTATEQVGVMEYLSNG